MQNTMLITEQAMASTATFSSSLVRSGSTRMANRVGAMPKAREMPYATRDATMHGTSAE